jgi:hypothetical protein
MPMPATARSLAATLALAVCGCAASLVSPGASRAAETPGAKTGAGG